LPLETRFLAGDLKKLFVQPDRLDRPVPEPLQRRAQALYLANFFQKDKIHDQYLAMEKELPNDPSVKYGLYQIERQRKNGQAALEYLDQAVAIDPVYGMAYLELADLAMERGRPDAALRMTDKAIATFPENPFVKLRKAETLIDLGHEDQAGPLLARLRGLPWSEVYYPNMPAYLDKLAGTTPPALPRPDLQKYGRQGASRGPVAH
jgi:predicted Zn-dependent protease